MPVIVSSHLNAFLNPSTLRQKLVLAQQVLEDYEFDTFAFMGMSGAFVGPALAVAMDKQMILVRKPGDNSHTFHRVEGNKEAQRYIIVDDFTASGDTKRTIIQAVRNFAPDANYLGLLEVSCLYNDDVQRYKRLERPFPLS